MLGRKVIFWNQVSKDTVQKPRLCSSWFFPIYPIFNRFAQLPSGLLFTELFSKFAMKPTRKKKACKLIKLFRFRKIFVSVIFLILVFSLCIGYKSIGN